MNKTTAHLKKQNVETTEDINKEIKNFRDQRLLEEQEEQKDVMIFMYI